jgi:DNA-binding transcriptional LysR family regulator
MTRAIDWESRIGRRVRLRDLHVLSAVAELGSMVKGAAHLGVSQPVVSQAIADLEAAIGHRLLDRNSRGVEPTPYGRALLKHGQMAFDDLRQGIREIEHLANPEAGEVWIGCPESLAGALLPPIIEPLSRKHPRATFHVSQSYTLSTQLEFADLRERKLDLVLARLVRPFGEFSFEDDLIVEHLFDDDLVIVAGADSPWARRRKIELKDLSDVPWVLPPKSWNLFLVKEAFQSVGLAVPQIRVETFSVALRNQLLELGSFVAAVPGSMLRLNAKHGLKALPVNLPKRPWPVVLVTLKNRTVAPMVQVFTHAARVVAGSMLPRMSTCNEGRRR